LLQTVGEISQKGQLILSEYRRFMRSIARRVGPSTTSSFSALAARARPRLGLLQRHLDPSPFELNTPFSIERASQQEIDIDYIRSPFKQQIRDFSTTAQIQKEKSKEKSANMSTQPEHPALMIPGPIEFDDAVLQSMSYYRSDTSQFWSNLILNANISLVSLMSACHL
jgi:hypothetical protein